MNTEEVKRIVDEAHAKDERPNLRGADLRGANLREADLSLANLRGANLRGADLRGANLRGAYLREADLSGADLRGAYLREADLSGADLRGAKGIYSFGPIGEVGRIGYAWIEKGEIIFGLGCHFGNLKNTIEAIRVKYGKNTTYEAQIKLAEKILQAQINES